MQKIHMYKESKEFEIMEMYSFLEWWLVWLSALQFDNM